jgi:hypothetical protein
MAGPALQLKPVRKGYLGRTNKWGSLGRPADLIETPLSDRFAPLTPVRARSDQRAETARSLRPHTANERLAATLPSPMHIRPQTSAPMRAQPKVPARRTTQPSIPEAAQRALIKACPGVVHSRQPSSSLASVFRAWDKDGSGKLGSPELQAALTYLGVRSDHLAMEALTGCVGDGSGGIDYNKLAGHVNKEMSDAIGATAGGVTSELRLVLDRMQAEGTGGGGCATPGPAPTQAQRVLMARVKRAAGARAEMAEAEAARQRLHASWLSAAPDAPSPPAASPRAAAESEEMKREAEAQARREERQMLQQFGDEYRNYQRRVPMFFPNINGLLRQES